MPPTPFEPLKLIPMGLAILLLTPIAMVFWRLAVHQPWDSQERRARARSALQESVSRVGTTNDDGSAIVAVAVESQEVIGFSERTCSWLSFYPRRWVGIVGLLAVATILIGLGIAVFVPQREGVVFP